MYSFTRGPNMPNIRHIRAYCRMGAYIREFCNGSISVCSFKKVVVKKSIAKKCVILYKILGQSVTCNT